MKVRLHYIFYRVLLLHLIRSISSESKFSTLHDKKSCKVENKSFEQNPVRLYSLDYIWT